MSDTPALVLKNVTKKYGTHLALDNLSLTIPRGVICGFIGPNGAGKTTAFSVISGFVQPSSGSVNILGTGAFDPYILKGRFGVLPQDAELSDRHTPFELLVHLARLDGMSVAPARDEANRLLSLVRLRDRPNDRISGLSHGMRRRVAVASALLGSPELVLLDEPMAGLDPVQAASLRDSLKQLAGVQTLVVSSHNLYELERLCDWVVMLDAGRLIAEGSMSEVTGESERLEWELSPGDVPLDALRIALPEDVFNQEGQVLSHSTSANLDESTIVVMRLLAESNIAIRGLRRGVGLEERFIRETHAHGAT
ncbi:MAG: ATP-binding cassette domain-containing protein [Rhodobacterales bacterium]|nr:ATP-binding cassette domain-containing protein [Rhodobacterales bacterium]